MNHLLLQRPSTYSIDIKTSVTLCLHHGHVLGALELCRHTLLLLLPSIPPSDSSDNMEVQDCQISLDEITTMIISCLKYGVEKYLQIINCFPAPPPTSSTTDTMSSPDLENEFENMEILSNISNDRSDNINDSHMIAYNSLWMNVLSLRYLWVSDRIEAEIVASRWGVDTREEDVEIVAQATTSSNPLKISKKISEVFATLIANGCKQEELHKLFRYLLALAIGIPNASTVILQMTDFVVNDDLITLEESASTGDNLVEVQYVEIE